MQREMEEEIFEEGQAEAKVEPEHESIKDFLEKIEDSSCIKELYEEWTRICEDSDINLPYVRNEVDHWFQECYQSRKDVRKLNADVSCEMAERRKEELLEKFNENMKMSADRCDDFVRKLSIQRELEATRNLPRGFWVTKAIECVEKENELMAKYKKVKLEAENEEVTQRIETEIQQTGHLCKTILQKVKQFCNGINNYQKYQQMYEEKDELINNFQLVLTKKNDQKATSQRKLTELERDKQQLKESMDQTLECVSHYNQELFDLLTQCFGLFTQLVNEITQHVDMWKRQFQFEYAELSANPRLERVAQWCALVGRQIHDLLVEALPQYYNSLHTNSIEPNIDSVISNYEDLLHKFMQQTFVVTEQEHYIIKVDKKHLPKIVVRILAADLFPPHSSKIEARFLYEDEINTFCPSNEVDAETMETIPLCAEFENKKKNATVSFQTGRRKKWSEGTFHSLQFKGKFVRPGNANSKQVHEEKYRILFITELRNRKLWTLSLPLVVTTGANQGCLCQASIMWQCFSTDVYQVPIHSANDLLWCQVAEMLQAKVRKLCPKHLLTEDNLSHLKKRLFGKDTNSETVTLKMFCFDKMVKTFGSDDELLNFSFWKWFIGVYNLIDRYLLNFWKEDLIFGFVSKEDAKEKLKRCGSGHSGTFILRFSDQNITDSQGVKSVFAHLTATVLIIKETEGRKKKCIYDLDVAGHSKLKIKNLASILMATIDKHSTEIYQYVYPGRRKREDTFDKHCNEETVVAGYNGTKDAFIIDLSHAMCALEIDSGKHARSPSIDSGFAPSPQCSETSAAPIKRSRASIEQRHPTITNMLNKDMFSPLSSPAHSTQSSCTSASPWHQPFSPNYQPGSPALTNSSPPNSMLQQQLQSSSMQNEFVSHSNSQDGVYHSLPTVINDLNTQPGPLPMGNFNLTGSVNSNKRCSPVQERNGKIHGTTTSDGCESGLGCSSLSDDSGSLSAEEQLEITVFSDDNSTLQCGGQNSNNVLICAVQMEGGEYKIVQDQATVNAILQQQNQHQIVSANQQAEPEMLQENFASTNQITASSQLLLLQALWSKVSEEERNNLLQQSAGFSPAFPSITTQPTNPTVNNTVDSMADMLISCSSNTLDTPTLTSAGSVVEAFNFSKPEIAEAMEMNSGNIDVNMFEWTSSGSGVQTNENISSGSSFEVL